MSAYPNPGYDPSEIAELRKECLEAGLPFVYNEEEPREEELAHIFFVGKHKGQEVIFDAAVYTLQMVYFSEVYEMAEAEARKEFPNYKGWEMELDENGNLKMPSPDDIDEEVEEFKYSVIQEIEEDGSHKVSETLEFDEDFEYGVGLTVSLNVDEITEEVLIRFVSQFNDGTFQPDPSLLSFRLDEDEE